MTMDEFERLTGFHPTLPHYEEIEKRYMAFNGDKQAFCMAYKDNKDGMADSIARAAFMKELNEKQILYKQIGEKDKEIECLRRKLEREQEWKPYESDHNVKQADYERLASSVPGCARYMTDEEAIEWICSEFDFSPSKIAIIHEIDEEEINRHRQCRKTGKKIDRRPVYCATDYHYIRFNTSRWCYEVWNGQLRPFYC